VLKRLEGHKRYPRAARELRHEGVAHVRFSINRQGHVLSSRLEKSSGSAILDREALDLIRRTTPLPPPPTEVPGDPIEMLAPIHFSFR
jgi:protein TonB